MPDRARNGSHGDSGFTLVEVLASLVIFSVSILALTRGVTNGLHVTGDIETRTLASIVAENQLARATTDPQFLTASTRTRQGESTQLEHVFDWIGVREATASPSLFEVTVEVAHDDQSLITRRTYVDDLLAPTPVNFPDAPEGTPENAPPSEPDEDPDDD